MGNPDVTQAPHLEVRFVRPLTHQGWVLKLYAMGNTVPGIVADAEHPFTEAISKTVRTSHPARTASCIVLGKTEGHIAVFQYWEPDGTPRQLAWFRPTGTMKWQAAQPHKPLPVTYDVTQVSDAEHAAWLRHISEAADFTPAVITAFKEDRCECSGQAA